jgi:Spy/CpxP family protein refolding chaperone
MIRMMILAGCLAAGAAVAQEADCPMHEQHTADQHATHQHPTGQSPYSGRTSAAIKALTPDQLDAYRNGTGAGMAIPAEMNGYPGPRHILDLADQLKLDADQKAKIGAIFDRMHESAVKLGQSIIDDEKKLDDAFAHGNASDAEVRSLTAEIAHLQGTLRYTHLAAHLAAKSVLSAEQVQLYNEARGYARLRTED